MAQPLALNHLNIPSPDPERLRRFYVEHLGFTLHGRMLYGQRCVFNIVEGPTLPAGAFHFGFWLDSKQDVQDWSAKLASAGVGVHEAYADHGAYATAYFDDPDGNVFELFYEAEPT